MANNLNKTLQNIDDIGTAARIIAATTGRNSLTRMTQDSIFQFPMLIDANAKEDDIITIARAFEKQFAALMVSAISLHGNWDISKFASAADFLKQFHSNKDIPTNIRAATKIIMEAANIIYERPMGIDKIANECWEILEDSLDMTIINEMYLPTIRTRRQIEERLAVANESKLDELAGGLKSATRKMQENSGMYSFGGSDPSLNNNKSPSGRNNSRGGESRTTVIRRDWDQVIDNSKLTSLEPTIINVQLLAHGAGKKGDAQFTQNVVLGIKTMIRLIPIESMILNMCDAAKGSNIIFKFIKWTKGELKFHDIFFGMGEARDTANSKGPTRWFKALRRRKAINDLSRFFNNKILPNTTIVISSYTAQRVYEETGVDFTEQVNALKLISKYYLLGFAILNTETSEFQVMMDGDADFSYTTMSGLKATEKKDPNLLSDKDVMRLMGRI